MNYQDWINYLIKRGSFGKDLTDLETGRRFPMTTPGTKGATRAPAPEIELDPWAKIAQAAQEKAAQAAANAKEAAQGAKSYLTEPQRLLHPETGLPYQTVDPTTGRFGSYAVGFTPGQRLARVGAPVAGATALGYGLSMAGKNTNPEAPISGEASATPENRIDPSIYPDHLPREEQDAPFREIPADVPLPPVRPRAVEIARDIPLPPRRPVESTPAPAPSKQDYQSSRGALVQNGKINWGDPDSAADFFRASKMLQDNPDMSGFARGGTAGKPHKDAALHKALEIISALISRR